MAVREEDVVSGGLVPGCSVKPQAADIDRHPVVDQVAAHVLPDGWIFRSGAQDADLHAFTPAEASVLTPSSRSIHAGSFPFPFTSTSPRSSNWYSPRIAW